jgi:hypothetical protein
MGQLQRRPSRAHMREGALTMAPTDHGLRGVRSVPARYPVGAIRAGVVGGCGHGQVLGEGRSVGQRGASGIRGRVNTGRLAAGELSVGHVAIAYPGKREG